MKLASSKIESRALNAIEDIIDEHPLMKHEFDSVDKKMCWDGYILLFGSSESEELQSKGNFEGRIPVQIKGHDDYGRLHIGRTSTKCSVELADLKAYSTEKGVLYFQVFTHGAEKDIFYASLYPSKILDYLELAKNKDNSNSISIPFVRADKDPAAFYNIVKQFHYEATKQGSAFNPLVADRIRASDFMNIKSINVSVLGVSNPIDAIKRLGTGDVCLYGKTEGDRYERPIEWKDGSTFFAGKTIEQNVCVGDELFYSQYTMVFDSKENMTMRLSPNLEMHLSEGHFQFKCISSLRDLYRDTRFILKLKEINSYSAGGHTFENVNANLTQETEEWFSLIVDMYETLSMIGVDLEQPLDYYTANEDDQIIRLINIKNGAFNRSLPYDVNRCLWKFKGKNIPLSIIKGEKNNELVNEVYTDKIKVVLPDPSRDNDKEYIMPIFTYQSVEVLSNLYSYKYDVFYRQIDESDINPFTSAALLECVLKMISVFDANDDSHFLDLADDLLSKIQEYLESEFVLLNRMQIKKRREKLSEEDITAIQNIDHPDSRIQFGKTVLLEDKKSASEFYNLFSDEDRKIYQEYPIYKLYMDLP